MSVPIPRYLRDIAVLEKQCKTWVHFSLKCTCGCEKFSLFENYLTKEEKKLEKPYYDALDKMVGHPTTCTKDEDGTLHHWILYMSDHLKVERREEVFVPDKPYFSGIKVLKIICAECGKEHLLFDSRTCGYDGITGEKSEEEMKYIPHFKQKCRDTVPLSVKIENDESLKAFKENTALDYSEDRYSDSFSWLAVYKIGDDGKKTKLFDFETA